MIQYTPRWQGAIQGHAINMCRRFYPKLAAHEEMLDLLQEAYIVYMRCKSKFYVNGTPQLFMAFYSKALHNKLCSMIKASPRYILLEDTDQAMEPMQDDLGHLLCVLREVPSEITDLLCKLGEDISLDAEREIKTRIQKMLKRGFLMRKIVSPKVPVLAPAFAGA